jgi:hypothetical protein
MASSRHGVHGHFPGDRHTGTDQYGDDYNELDRREDAIPEPDDVDDTQPQPPGSEWLDERGEHGLPTWVDDPAKVAAVEKHIAETPPEPLTPGEQAEQAALDELATLRKRVGILRKQEIRYYAKELTRAISEHLERLNVDVPISVNVGPAPQGADLRYAALLPGHARVTAATTKRWPKLSRPLPRRGGGPALP